VRRSLAAAACVIAILAVTAAPAHADHGVGHPNWSCCAGLANFAEDFPELLDGEWGYPLGGWGGVRKGTALHRTPVIFVHGNGEDASFWDLQNETAVAVNVRQRFKAAGYGDQELWALSYNGQRCGQNTCQTYNEVNVADFAAFARAVLAYTGAKRFDVVAHSLGVTVVRRALRLHEDLRMSLEDAVFASGANHGTSVCRGSESLIGCDEIHPGSPWLAALNTGDETPGEARYVTICDCTGATDHFFLAVDARSPQLDGAQNIEVPGSAHFVTARGPAVVTSYIPLVARKTTTSAPAMRDEPKATTVKGRQLAATGVGSSSLWLVLLLAAILLARATRRGART